MKIHLGCGKLYLNDYINIDICSNVADMICDVNSLDFSLNCIEEIYMSHILEHFKRNEVIHVLYKLTQLIVIGGKIRICVPDFDSVVDYYLKNDRQLNLLIGFLNGGQKDNYDIHYMNYNFDLIQEILLTLGFNNIMKYDTHEFLNDNQDDYSKCYLPHMDKNGVLMSLNIVATKERNVNLSEINKYVMNHNIFKKKI